LDKAEATFSSGALSTELTTGLLPTSNRSKSGLSDALVVKIGFSE
jgi:hypothetical protein